MKKILLTLLLSAFVQASFASTLQGLQADWAIANYQLTGDEQAAAFASLTKRAESAVREQPNDPELLLWEGIIKSTYAGKAGGLSALSLVKAAKSSFEKAMEINDGVMQGSAYTSLGALYYQVPGWPLAFGSDKKARELLEKALVMNPDGIDSNYFYGDFLVQQKDYTSARRVLQHALEAPQRPGREVADYGRRQEIKALLEKIDS
jgi:tetratricopeptide (TPR) repeat protein